MSTSPLAPSRWRPRRASAPTRAAVLAVAVASTLALGGCGLRLETPDPPVLVADDAEVLRDRSAREAAALADAATEAAATAEAPVATALTALAEASGQHLAALGGVYVPFPAGTPGSDTTPTPTPTVSPAPRTPADVLELLRAATERARTDATAGTEPGMTLLLTSIALDRQLLADALTTALDGTTPELGDVPAPDGLPAGLDAQVAAVLVQSEDAAGMAWEIVAARAADGARERAAARAVLHRDRAQAWAEAAGIDGTGTDPRRSAYDLPDTITDATLPSASMWAALGEIERALGETYAGLVPDVEPARRSGLLDAALEALRRAASLGATIPAFPGMPPAA